MPWRESAADLERARAERPFVIPTRLGRLYAVYTPPAPEARPAGLCAVLLTSPRGHRNRMWVEGARRLAAQGFGACRMDFHGAGDSEGETGFRDPDQPFREETVALIRHLREQFGHRRFVLSGACFDARTALAACMDEADAIAGLLFMAAPVMELDTMVKADADRKGWGHLLKALRNRENWSALSRPARWRYMGTMVGRLAQRSAGVAPAGSLPLSRSFLEHFDALVRSRAHALFLYGLEDVEYESFRVAERLLFPRLAPRDRRRFEIEVWPGRIHGFLEIPRQREALERALQWFIGLSPGSHAAKAPDPSAEDAWTSR